MKKLIELFNKKYGHIYGIIDDSIDNEDVFKAYKIIKTLCADDIEIMEMLEKVKLPEPKTASESIEKININVEGSGFDENDLIKYNIPFDGREVTEIIYDGDMENYEHVEVEEGVYLVKISDKIIDYKYLEGGSMTVVSNDRTVKLILHLDEVTDEKAYTFNDTLVLIVVESIEEIPLGVGVWILQENSDDTHIYPSKIEYYNEGNFNLLDEKYIPYMVGKKLENNAEIFNNMFNVATGLESHAEGNYTSAYGDASHAEGVRTEATAHYSHAEGYETNATGLHSHAEGDNTIAKGDSSHAEGENTTSLGHNSHAEGNSSNSATSVIQDLSVLTPDDSIMTAWNSNKFSLTKGNGSHVEGKNSLALGESSHAEGNASTASGYASHAECNHTVASGEYSHAEGNFTTASGEASHAEGWDTTALGFSSHAEGGGTHATGLKSHAEGDGTTASGEASHTEGRYCQSTALTAHAEGDYCNATGIASHAEGGGTHATGNYSHSEGYSAEASGENSHAEGSNTRAIGLNSHVEGFQTKASSEDQHVQGRYNIEDTENKYAHIVGNGTYDSNKDKELRSNAHTLDWDGNGWYAGKLTQEGVPTEDKDLTTKKYVDDKTEILPVANKYIIFEDAVPRFMEHPPTYGTGGGGGSGINSAYIFDNLQNTDMIVHSAKFNLIISFNDGTEDITENINVNVNEQTRFTKYVDDYFVILEYNENTNLIMVAVVKGVQTDDGHEEIPCTVTKATFICILYSNLLKSNVMEDIEYKKITNVPTELQYLTDGQNETLRSKEYYDLYDNSFVWDMNKINERLDENSGVTRNTFSTTYSGKVIKVNQKDSEGIGFGQLVPIKRDKNVAIFVRAEQDVIIKVYNPNTKELIFTMEDIYINSFRYAKYSIPFHKVRDIDNIFIAFTIKDIPTNSFSNNTIYDLMVIDESTFLKKKEILTKTNTEEYHPTGDYNPATKKYVDERTFSREVVTVNNVNDSLTLTTDKNQYATLAVPVEIILPTVTSFTELHLFFNGSEGVTIGTTNVKWESQVTIENNKSYEIIFTYVNESIGWLGKTIVYS